MMRKRAVVWAGLALLSLASCAAPSKRKVERLVREFSGETEARSRSSSALRHDYAYVVDALLPGMAAESIEDREQPQRDFERICLRAARPGAERERAALCEAIMERLGPETPRVWMLRQIERIGGAEAVETLVGLLDDADAGVRDPARRALQNNTSEAAAAALRKALADASTSDARVALINALGARRDARSTAALTRLADDTDAATALAALAALGEIGGDEALGTLSRHWQRGPHRETAAAALLRVAGRLREAGERARAADICLSLYQPNSGRALRVAALSGYAAAAGAGGVPRLLEIVRGASDERMQHIAARLASEVPGGATTRALLDELRASPAEMQSFYLQVLADRGDSAARSAAVELLTSEESDVRVAAAGALAQLGDSSTISPLVQMAGDGDGDGVERDAARGALARLRGLDVDTSMLRAMNSGTGAQRAELIRALAARFYREATPLFFEAAVDADETVRVAAFEALGEVAAPADVSGLIERLIAETDDDAREAGEDAVVAVAGRMEDVDSRSDAVLAALPHANGAANANRFAKASLLRVLGRLGGERSLTAIRTAVGDADAEDRDAAIRVLCKWKNADVLDDVKAIAGSADSETHRVLALRGYVRLVRLPSERTPSETLDMFKWAMQIAARLDEKKLVLAGVGDLLALDALQFAESYLANEALRDEAAAAMLTIARNVCGMHGEASRAAVDRILALEQAETLHKRANEALEHIERFTGYVLDWVVSGPYMRKGLKNDQILATMFEPEEPSSGVLWRGLPAENSRDPWRFDLAQVIGGGNRCAYVRTGVWSDVERRARLEIGSDDGVKVWLNGVVVHTNNASRGVSIASDKADVTLRAGWNTLMLKISQGGGSWGFACGIKTQDGGNISGLRFDSAKGEPTEALRDEQ